MKALIIWELGSDLGHVANIATVAGVLIDLGYKVHCSFCDFRDTQRFMSGLDVSFVPFPKGRIRAQEGTVESLADVLMARDFGEPVLLAKQVRKWNALYNAIKPDLVIYDYAPTAMFAARGCKFRKIVLGNGWTAPPPGHKAIPLNLWKNIDPVEMAWREAAVVSNINKVGRLFGFSDIAFVGDLFRADQTLIYDFPAMDIYESMRQECTYLGPIHEESRPLAIKDVQTLKPSVFAYLKAGASVSWRTLDALNRIDADKYIFTLAKADAVRRRADKRTQVFDRPLNLKRLLPKISVAICHAGAGTLGRAILANTPTLTLPLQLEQANKAELYRRTGAGLSAAPDAQVEELELNLNHLLHEPVFKERTADLKASIDTRLSARSRIRLALQPRALPRRAPMPNFNHGF